MVNLDIHLTKNVKKICWRSEI